MEVEGDVRAVHLVAALVGTGEVLLDLHRQPPVLLPVLHLVLLQVSLLQRLPRTTLTSSFSTSLCSTEVLSDSSLMRLKLSSFLR